MRIGGIAFLALVAVTSPEAAPGTTTQPTLTLTHDAASVVVAGDSFLVKARVELSCGITATCSSVRFHVEYYARTGTWKTLSFTGSKEATQQFRISVSGTDIAYPTFEYRLRAEVTVTEPDDSTEGSATQPGQLPGVKQYVLSAMSPPSGAHTPVVESRLRFAINRADGRPLANAPVLIYPNNQTGSSTSCWLVRTDDNGGVDFNVPHNDPWLASEESLRGFTNLIIHATWTPPDAPTEGIVSGEYAVENVILNLGLPWLPIVDPHSQGKTFTMAPSDISIYRPDGTAAATESGGNCSLR